jgi:hypothetical protein
MESAGIIPEIEPGGDEESTEQEIEEMKQEMESEERLSVFEDFLQNLDIEDSGDDDDDDGEKNNPDLIEPDLQ